MLDVRRLRVLSQLAEQGSFSAAAGALGMTQSAVSQQIAALERDLGAGCGAAWYPTGRADRSRFGSHQARDRIFARLEAAEQEVAEIAERRRGRLRFGCFPTVLGTLMPVAFARFPPVAPGRPTDRRRRSSAPTGPAAGVRGVGSGRDLRPRSAARCGRRKVRACSAARGPFQAVLPVAHPLARRRAVHLQDLRKEPWIGGAPSSGWYRIVRHACQQAGFSPRADFASDDYIAVQALVAAGLGVSVIPGLAVAHPLPGVVVRPLASTAPVRRICAAWPIDGYRGPTLDAMVECLQLSGPGHAVTLEFGVHLPLIDFADEPWTAASTVDLCSRSRGAGLPVHLRQRPSRVPATVDRRPDNSRRGPTGVRGHDDRHHRCAPGRARTSPRPPSCWRPCTPSPAAD